MAITYDKVGQFLDPEEERRLFAQDVFDGLSETPKSIPSKYFYDTKGSKLFQKITELDEYYLTRCDEEILKREKSLLGDLFNRSFSLVDLGSGDARKTKILLRDFVQKGKKFKYIPVDISESQMIELTESLKQEFGDSLEVNGIISEYETALRWLIHHSQEPKLVLFLGGNSGNYHPREIRRNLRGLQMRLQQGDFLFVGFDLKKNRKILERAYGDCEGITKDFNLNLLRRINRELGANFDIASFGHHPYFNEERDAMESWITNESSITQKVDIPYIDASFTFRPNEAIHTELSYKFEDGENPPENPNKPGQIGWLARATGYECIRLLQDSKGYFANVVWKVKKSG